MPSYSTYVQLGIKSHYNIYILSPRALWHSHDSPAIISSPQQFITHTSQIEYWLKTKTAGTIVASCVLELIS